MLTDPVADMLTRVRNANQALHDQVRMPASKLKIEIAKLLEAEAAEPRAATDGADQQVIGNALQAARAPDDQASLRALARALHELAGDQHLDAIGFKSCLGSGGDVRILPTEQAGTALDLDDS